MDIIQEIAEAIDDYTRLHYESPNKIYIARKTLFEVMDKAKEYIIFHVMSNMGYQEMEYEICGLEVKISKNIKDGFVVVHEWM